MTLGASNRLFQCTAKHDYFVKGPGPFVWVPTEETHAQLNTMGLYYRVTGQQLEIYDIDGVLLTDDDVADWPSLSFQLRTNDPAILGYTAAASQSDLGHFSFKAEAGVSQIIASESEFTASPLTHDQILAEIDVPVSQLSPGRTLNLQFPAAEAFWVYRIRLHETLDEPEIFVGEDALSFEPHEPMQTLSGRWADFKSSKPIKLAASYPHRFQLRCRTPHGVQVINDRLPHPSSKSIRFEPDTANGPVISEIFVHL